VTLSSSAAVTIVDAGLMEREDRPFITAVVAGETRMWCSHLADPDIVAIAELVESAGHAVEERLRKDSTDISSLAHL